MERKMEKKEPKISIYVSCHKESYVPEMELLKPIQVGAAIAEKGLPNMLHDDVGENISGKNRQYCELTAQYWAWKNDKQSDYLGFMHYRRYFSFSPCHFPEELYNDGHGKVRDGIVFDFISEKALKKLGFTERMIKSTVSQYDIIVPTVWTNGESMYDQYKNWEDACIEDFDIMIQIICEYYPKYIPYVKKYINGSEGHLYNMFIMRRDVFEEYSEFVFSVLSMVENKIDVSGRNGAQERAVAYLGERLLDIFYLYIQDKGNVKTCELQRALFIETSPVKKVMPAFEANNVAVVLSANDYYVPYLSTVIQSIIQNAKSENNYDLIVMHSSIEEDSIKRVTQQCQGHINISIRFVNVSQYIKKYNFYIHMHFTIETWYRLVIQDLFESYSKVVYLDSDLVVDTDIADLYNIDVEDYLLAATRDADVAGLYNRKDIPRKEYMDYKLKLRNPYDYFQAGVILINIDEFKKTFTVKELLTLATTETWEFVDQDLLNTYCQGRVKLVDMSWNVLTDWKEENWSRIKTINFGPVGIVNEYMAARKKPRIIHYAGFQKAWDMPYCDMAEYFWRYARQTPYYEIILDRMNMALHRVTYSEEKVVNHTVEENIDYDGIRVQGVPDMLYADGLLIKLINMINRKYPIGSKKRNRLKKIAKLFLK